MLSPLYSIGLFPYLSEACQVEKLNRGQITQVWKGVFLFCLVERRHATPNRFWPRVHATFFIGLVYHPYLPNPSHGCLRRTISSEVFRPLTPCAGAGSFPLALLGLGYQRLYSLVPWFSDARSFELVLVVAPWFLLVLFWITAFWVLLRCNEIIWLVVTKLKSMWPRFRFRQFFW